METTNGMFNETGREIVLQLFCDEIDYLNDDLREEAAALARRFYGDRVKIPNSLSYGLVVGFLMGLSAGARITAGCGDDAQGAIRRLYGPLQ